MARWLALLAIVPFVIPCVTYLMHILYFAGTNCDSKAMLTGKTVIVTGANTGIGKTTALDMAARGARVILACRNAARALPALKEIQESTKNRNIVFMELDLASLQSVRDFAQLFLEKEKRLDILINNAGLITSDEPKLSKDGIELTIAVNHLGPFLLTNLLLDIMKKSGPGTRIVNVSSGLYNMANPAAFRDFDLLRTDGTSNFHESINFDHMGDDYREFLSYVPVGIKRWFLRKMTPRMIRYNNSKLANVLFTIELAKRLASTGITSYVLHPGVIKTEIGVERNPSAENKPSIKDIAASVGQFLNPFKHLLKTLEGGAQTTICCAVSEKLSHESGLYYSDCSSVKVHRPEAIDPLVTAAFWEWSSKVVAESSRLA